MIIPSWEIHPGTGPYLLLVHGFLSSRAQWHTNLQELSTVCRPIVMELYGHGRSPSPDDGKPYMPTSYISAMEQIRTVLDIENWFVCGSSLGSGLTIRYAITHPNRVRGHIFTNSMSAFADPSIANPERSAQRSDQIRAGGMGAIEQIPVHPRYAKRIEKKIHEALLKDAMLLNPKGIANTVQFTTPLASVRNVLCANQSPALLTYGHFENRFSEHREFAEANMPHLKVLKIDAGHAVNMQGARQFNRAVIDFLSTL